MHKVQLNCKFAAKQNSQTTNQRSFSRKLFVFWLFQLRKLCLALHLHRTRRYAWRCNYTACRRCARRAAPALHAPLCPALLLRRREQQGPARFC
ncbi:hypothetical protein, partial [Paenibacillus sp. DMB5]|uniref:hypothetical protein n=1 Tax=Paenibacillus sp. DMB5 TaxID=1780103 RepID=UPI000AA08433